MKDKLGVISYKLKGLFLIINLSLITYHSLAQPYVTIPDANFARFLQKLVPYAMNSNGQLNTSSPAVTALTNMTVNNKNITNLTGIQYFTSLPPGLAVMATS